MKTKNKIDLSTFINIIEELKYGSYGDELLDSINEIIKNTILN